MRRRALLSVAAAMLTACTSAGGGDVALTAGPSTTASFEPATTVGADSPPSSTSVSTDVPVATPTRAVTEPDAVASFIPRQVDVRNATAPAGTLEVLECAWRGVGQYRLGVDWQPADAGPVEIPASLEVWFSDTDAVFAEGVLALPGVGTYEVEIDGRPVGIGGGDDELLRAGRHGPGGPGGNCDVRVAEGPSLVQDGDRTPAIDRAAPDVWPAGSLEELASRVDMADPAAPLWPLPIAVFGGVEVPIDRWYVAPDLQLRSLSVEQSGTCLQLLSSVVVEADRTVSIEQSRGCVPRSPSGAERSVLIEDPNWRVVVQGGFDDVNHVVDHLVGFTAAAVEPVTGPPGVGADAYFDGFVDANPQFEIVARLPWRSGELAVLRDMSVPAWQAIEETVFYGVEDWNGGGGGRSCLEYAIGISRVFDDGYGWFVSADPTNVVVVPVEGGGTVTVELDPAADGYGAAIVDVADVPIDDVERFPEIRTADGELVPCTQNDEGPATTVP